MYIRWRSPPNRSNDCYAAAEKIAAKANIKRTDKMLRIITVITLFLRSLRREMCEVAQSIDTGRDQLSPWETVLQTFLSVCVCVWCMCLSTRRLCVCVCLCFCIYFYFFRRGCDLIDQLGLCTAGNGYTYTRKWSRITSR